MKQQVLANRPICGSLLLLCSLPTITGYVETDSSIRTAVDAGTSAPAQITGRRELQSCGSATFVAAPSYCSNYNSRNCYDDVPCGETCEGDGECGTKWSLDNCGGYDVYVRSSCTPSPTPQPTINNVMTDSNIRIAVAAWLADSTAAEALYGHISRWGTQGVTDMSYLFCASTY